jgi:hypothetical protein
MRIGELMLNDVDQEARQPVIELSELEWTANLVSICRMPLD